MVLTGAREIETAAPAAARGENATAAALAAVLVGGLYADGWAHANLPGLETFFTPWHAVLYSGFALLAAWVFVMVWRRRHHGWRKGIPYGYALALLGVGLFLLGGLLDMAWHVTFGVEAGIDALVSPPHLLLLTGGMLMVTAPIRSATRPPGGTRSSYPWTAAAALAVATALAGFFLIYLSVFSEPGARFPLTSIPEGMHGHREGELPVIAGLAGYLLSTLLVTAPVLFVHRQARPPRGVVTVLVAAVALPAAALGQLAYLTPALGAIAGASLVDLVLAVWPDLPDLALAAIVPAAVWSGQLVGLAVDGELRWAVELWAGVVGLSALLSVATAVLLRAPAPARPVRLTAAVR